MKCKMLCVVFLAAAQNVPHWTCVYTVSGSASTPASPADVANYLAKSLTAGGQEFCAAQPTPSGFCDATLGVTGLCAAQPAPASGSRFCRLAPAPKGWTMTTGFGSPGRDCAPNGKGMSADAQSSLLQYLAPFMPGFKLTLPQGARALQCVQQYVSIDDWVSAHPRGRAYHVVVGSVA